MKKHNPEVFPGYFFYHNSLEMTIALMNSENKSCECF
jgi:hypothetical protein